MTETGERVCCLESLKLQSGYAFLPFQTLRSISALVGIHLKKEKSCLKKRPTPITYPHKRYWYNFAVAHTLAEYKGIFRGAFNRELIGAGNSLCETCFPCARGEI